MYKKITIGIGVGVAIGLIVAMFAIVLTRTNEAQGSAPSGVESSVATSGPISFTAAQGNLGIILFATSTCASRVISTGSTSIMFTLTDKATSSLGNVGIGGIYGHEQLGSTTIAYDSGLYGCGMWKLKTGNAGSIHITETK